MNKMLKRSLVICSITALAQLGFKMVRMTKALLALLKSLKEDLRIKFGEEPKLGGTLMANIHITVTVVAKFSTETLEKYPEIEETIKTHIAENYPILNIKRLKVLVCDKNMNRLELLKKEHPIIYKYFGRLIEKKLQAQENSQESTTV
jgi:hypothetical protein